MRFIGSKTLLLDHIRAVAEEKAPDARSFCDIFSGTAAVVGSLLNIKPLIAVQNGKVEAVHKTRGLAAAFHTYCSALP